MCCTMNMCSILAISKQTSSFTIMAVSSSTSLGSQKSLCQFYYMICSPSRVSVIGEMKPRSISDYHASLPTSPQTSPDLSKG